MAHEQFQSCITACDACAAACDHCASACLQEAGVADMARCIRLDIDCAQMCRLASAAMARGSDLAPLLCEACAQVCEECGDECARHMMDHCQACADACRHCAAECRTMASRERAARTEPARVAPAH